VISGLLRIIGVIVEWLFLRWKRDAAEADSELNELEATQQAITEGDEDAEDAVQAQFSQWRRENQLADLNRDGHHPDSDRL